MRRRKSTLQKCSQLDSQIVVDDFSHQNFAIWAFLAWVMVIFMKKEVICSFTNTFTIFFTKMAITQASKVQIAKLWCLKSSTDIWLSCGNIYSISKINNIEIEGKKVSKPAKNCQFFTLKKLKLHFLKILPRLDLTAFFCDTLYMSTNFSHWQNPCDTPDLVGSLHRHRDPEVEVEGNVP